jgi:integrase
MSRPTTHWPKTVSVGHARVKLYRNAHPDTASGWIYVLAWNSPAGRKREKFADLTEAFSEARLKATQLSNGRIEGALMSAGDRDELQAARKITRGTPLLAALAEWEKAKQLTRGNILPAAREWAARNGRVAKRITIAAVVKEFCSAKTAAQKTVTRDHRFTFNRITTDLGEQFIDSVSARQLDQWLASWEHPVTRNTRRKRLVSIWRWARRKGYLPREAQTEAELTEYAPEPAPEIGIIDRTRFETAVNHIRHRHPELLPALVLAGFCGLRRTEVHGQLWEDINLNESHVFVTKAKRGTPARRLVPLSEAAVQWLLLSKKREAHVCPLVPGRDGLQPSLAIDGIRRILTESQIFPGWKLPKNCFRHSYISHRVAATGDIPRTSMDAGTSVQKVNRHYRQIVSEAEGKAWFNIALRAQSVADVVAISGSQVSPRLPRSSYA